MTLPPMILQERLIWDEQGHLAEPAVTAIADGELSLVSPAAISHADSCAGCSARVGRAALFALDLSEALTALASPTALASSAVPAFSAVPASSAVPALRPLPLGLLAATLLVALLGSLPNLIGLLRILSRLVHALPSLVRASSLVLHSPVGSRALAIAGVASAAMLLVMGITIARLDLRTLGQPLEKGAR